MSVSWGTLHGEFGFADTKTYRSHNFYVFFIWAWACCIEKSQISGACADRGSVDVVSPRALVCRVVRICTTSRH
jgi:hypothetical protein